MFGSSSNGNCNCLWFIILLIVLLCCCNGGNNGMCGCMQDPPCCNN